MKAAAAAAKTLDPSHFDEVELKAHSISEAASIAGNSPGARSAPCLPARIRRPGAGRCARRPGHRHRHLSDADVKIYVTATPEVRARRRSAEYRAQGRNIDEAAVLADIRKRDERDQNRAAAPLRRAPDAHLLDTTHLDIDAAIQAAIDIVEASRSGRGRG